MCSDDIADVWCEMLWQCMIFQTAKVPKSAKISQRDILELQGMRCNNFFVQQKCSGVYAIYDGCICFLGCLPLCHGYSEWVNIHALAFVTILSGLQASCLATFLPRPNQACKRALAITHPTTIWQMLCLYCYNYYKYKWCRNSTLPCACPSQLIPNINHTSCSGRNSLGHQLCNSIIRIIKLKRCN